MLSFEELLHPITIDEFFNEYKGKKILIIRSDYNKFENYFSWEEFDQYLQSFDLNGYDRCPQLQLLFKNGTKYCKRKKLYKLDKKQIFKLWKEGSSIILTVCENLNKLMWNQCVEFEKYYDNGCANIYCSYKKDSNVFAPHADNTDNFLFHVRGNLRWFIYKEFINKKHDINNLTIDESFELNCGDLLYIPKYLFHNVETISPRISISFHFFDKNTTKSKKREPWLDWIPPKI